MNPVIEVTDLVFEYPNKRALHSISFTIQPSSVVALVGPNGAGKTTLLRCLAALETPFSGSVMMAGVDTQNDPRQVHQNVAYLADFFGLYDGLTVYQSLLHMASIHGVATKKIEPVIEEIAAELDLAKLIDAKAGTLSRGQRQRLAIAMAIIHKPPVLLLDEPAAGLDPEARHSLSALITSFRAKGMTIIVSSHILSELEDYSTEMLTIQNGSIAGHCTLHELQSGIQRRRVRLKSLRAHQEIVTILEKNASVTALTHSQDDVVFIIEGGPEVHHDLLKGLVHQDLGIYSFAAEEISLQEIYLSQISQSKHS